VTAVLALLAGGSNGIALRLGLAMLVIQFGIGTVNDLVDRERDMIAKPAKPLASGLVVQGEATLLALAAFTIGALLAASVSLATLLVAAGGAAIGLAYDLRLKGTAGSWLPFALGIPLLPVFAWIGAIGTLPPSIIIGALLAVPAGLGLAIANALPDAEGDVRAGASSIAVALGRSTAWRLGAAVLGLVVIGALLTYTMLGGLGAQGWPLVAEVGLVISATAIAIGLALGGAESVARRALGWEIQAAAFAAFAASWVAGLAASGRL
jgi:4-hydroxybenzoate polyprenyltransferase